MIIKTNDFKSVVDKILFAVGVDKTAGNLEVVAKEGALYLNVTNKEFYTSVKFKLDDEAESFRAVVDAMLFLNLISGITTETFELTEDGNVLKVKAGRSNYKLAMIYDNTELLALPKIELNSPSVEMSISKDILMSILTVNSKEIAKAKNMVNVNELQKLYYIDETGCFTFTSGACVNSFTLAKPVRMLLNERIVKLFKLFDTNVHFMLGHEKNPINNQTESKVVFSTENVYVAAKITCDDLLISKVQGPCNASKGFINATYPNHSVISVNEMLAAINRLMLFTKNSIDKANLALVPAKFTITSNEIEIVDEQNNIETVTVENDSYVSNGSYTMSLNLADLKLVLESYKNEHITMNCGPASRSVVINCGPVSNLLLNLDKKA